MKKLIQIVLVSLLLATSSVMAEPTVKEIYQMAQTNKEQALIMIDQVIDAHPKSAKAYFVKTELLLSMKRVSQARIAYNHADKLDPTFSYVNPDTLVKVRKALGIRSASSFDTTNIILIGGIVLVGIFIIWLIIRKREKPQPQYVPQTYNNRPITPYHNTSGISPAPATSGGSGTGSGIMGGLATGVAVGAGAVAGAALANHFINGNHSSSNNDYTPSSDFGVSDSSSWDSSSDSSSDSDSNW